MTEAQSIPVISKKYSSLPKFIFSVNKHIEILTTFVAGFNLVALLWTTDTISKRSEIDTDWELLLILVPASLLLISIVVTTKRFQSKKTKAVSLFRNGIKLPNELIYDFSTIKKVVVVENSKEINLHFKSETTGSLPSYNFNYCIYFFDKSEMEKILTTLKNFHPSINIKIFKSTFSIMLDRDN